MKLRLSHAKWCFAFVIFTIANIQISVLILRLYDYPVIHHKSESEYFEQYIAPLRGASPYPYLRAQSMNLNHSQRSSVKINVDFESVNQFRRSNHKPSLPTFATDSSEFFFGAIIERQFQSWDLHITAFLLCHHMLEPESKNGVEKVHPATQEAWKRGILNFRGVKYHQNGQRREEPAYFCKITNAKGFQPYIVRAFFVPNRLTSDSNANRRLDILRCPMADSKEAYFTLARSNNEVHVEILRESSSIINFTIPWDTRKTGYMLSSPPVASKLDGWRGFDASIYSQASSEEFQSTADDVHICMPGTKRFPSKDVIPLFLEFVSHHTLLGAGHIYFPVSAGWKSPHMERILELFRSYIDEEKLSIVSHSADGLDMVHSVAGLTWHRLMIKVMQVNMCLYESKGVADYVLVLDIDEFFIPRPAFSTIGAVIRAVDTLDPLPLHASNVTLESLSVDWKGGQGWADGEAHPLCFLALESQVIAGEKTFTEVDPLHPWIGERFKHGTEPKSSGLTKRFAYTKAILPTRVIFQGGLNMGGACMLERRWTGCRASDAKREFCGNPDDVRRMGVRSDESFVDFRKDHNFYETVLDKDRKNIDGKTHAVVHHYLLHHPDVRASAIALESKSVYATHFFENVLQDLRDRHLDIVMLIPDPYPESAIPGEDKWGKLFTPDIMHNFAAWKAASAASGPVVVVDKLPVNYVDRANQRFVPLPNFAVDLTDFAISALIERVSDSFDLWLSTFFLCHGLLEPKDGPAAISGEKVSPEVQDMWKKTMLHFEQTKYYENGERKQPPNYFCKITHASGYEPYVVRGRFVPNKLTPDSNSNRRTDIFRCKMKNTEQAYMQLAGTDAIMEVEILRGDTSVLAYRIPWKTRTTGFMFEAPPDAGMFDPWKGFDRETPGVWKHDNLYMCVPGMETPPSKTSLPLYLEFIQHHLLLGVDHMFIGALFSWKSVHMQRLLRILRSYIQANQLSMASTAGDGLDGIYSTAGLVWARDNVKNFHVNMCTYYAKGTADYVGVWDFDEHFIPLGGNKNIIDVIRAMESPVPLPYIHPPNARPEDVALQWKSGRGLADADGHPLCYIILNAVCTLPAERMAIVDVLHPWLGERFAHGSEEKNGMAFKKSIRPTRTIFQGGLHLAGACRLPYPYNGCGSDVDCCWGKGPERGQQYRLTKLDNGTVINFNLNHRFDEILMDEDAKVVNQYTEGVINHIQYHRFWFQASPEALGNKSEYTTRYFPTVMRILADKGLELPVTLPEHGSRPFPEADQYWVKFTELNDATGHSRDAALEAPQIPNSARSDTRGTGHTGTLPQWATDRSEAFLGALIERVSDSWDLYLTTFLLGHKVVEGDRSGQAGQSSTTGGLKVSPEAESTWREAVAKMRGTQYTQSGARTNATSYSCRIKHSHSSPEYYTVEGVFVPNNLTPDPSDNQRVDILRCKLRNAQQAYMTLARSASDSLQVQILRDSVPLISFSVPWNSRVNGKTLVSPAAVGTAAGTATGFDPWKGFSEGAPGVWTNDKVYMCVPGIEAPPSRRGLPIFLEFVQHHMLMGVQHMFLTMAFDWESIHMQRYLRVLRSYIDEGSVSVTSHSTEGDDFTYTLLGSSWHREFVKTLQLNMCVYFAKGVADYVGIWNVDEFFIPKGTNRNLVDTLDAVSASGTDNKPAFASSENHPFCYIQLQSQFVANQAPKSYADLSSAGMGGDNSLGQVESEPVAIDLSHPWIGQRFAHGVERGSSADQRAPPPLTKAIIPTRRMFQIGSHRSGACWLESPWSGCEAGTDLCYGSPGASDTATASLASADPKSNSPRSIHRFDEVVYDADARKLEESTEGVIYHFLFYRYSHTVSSDGVLKEKNDYALRFFNKTVTELTARNLDLLLTLPEDVAPFYPRGDQKWTLYNLVWDSRSTMGSLFPGGELRGISQG